MTYQKIGEAMGISTPAATAHVKDAERRFREYESYHDEQKSNDRPAQAALYGKVMMGGIAE